MKSRTRQEMEKKIAEGITERSRFREESKTVHKLDLVAPADGMAVILGLPINRTEKDQVNAVSIEEKSISMTPRLILKEGISGARANFTKYPNEIHELMASQLDINDSIAYIRLWRDSWGFGRNYCRVGYGTIVKTTTIRSRTSAIAAMNNLKKKRFIALILDENGHAITNQDGTIYRIFTPNEIISGVTEEGIPLSSIPESGILYTNIVEKEGNANDGVGISQRSIPDRSIPDRSSISQKYTGISKGSIPKGDTPKENLDDVMDEAGISRGGIPKGSIDLKIDIKDTLSPDIIIDLFYTGIGQSKISNEKRERALKNIEELEADGFSLEDIACAAEWTPDNATEKLYDFKIIKHTIGQAMAAKAEEEAVEERKQEKLRLMKEKEAEEERKAHEEKMLKAYKDSLPEDERKRLRTLAESEVMESGEYKSEYVTDALIAARENEILRRESHI